MYTLLFFFKEQGEIKDRTKEFRAHTKKEK